MTNHENGVESTSSVRKTDLVDVLTAILRHKALLILCTLLTSGGLILYSASKEPVFNAEARLALESGGFQTGFLSEVAVLATSAPPESKEVEILGSRKLVRMVASHPNSKDVPEFARGMGLGLGIKVEDFDRYWPQASILRRFTGEAAPTGSLEVGLVQPFSDPWTTRIDIRFIETGKFEAKSSREIEPEIVTFDDRDTQPIVSIFGRRYQFRITGDLTGRSFGLLLRNDDATVGDLISRLRIKETSRGSSVLELAYSDTSPSRAQAFVNRLAEVYVAYKRDRLAAQAEATEAFISKEIERIKDELTTAEDAIVAYQEAQDQPILPEIGAAVIQQQSALDLERARLSLKVHAHENVVARLDDPSVSLMTLTGSIELDPLLQSLFESLRRVEDDSAELAIEYKDTWPELAKLRDRADEIRVAIRETLQSRLDGLYAQDQSLVDALAGYDEQLSTLPRSTRELIKLQRNASSHEAVYLILMQKLQEAKIAQAATIEQVEIIDRALPPRIRALPNVRANLVIGVLLGLALGSLLALGRESLTRRIRTAAQLESATQLPVLGTIPDFRRGLGKSRRARGRVFLALLQDPDSSAAEAYRSLRASLRFAAREKTIQTMAITSAGQGEGKSTTTADLAIAMAQGGKRVLLVDADLRRPVVHKYFEKEVTPGLSEVLRGESSALECIHDTGVENLSILTAGSAVRNPGDLLASAELSDLTKSWQGQFDYVLFDVPPVLAVADASAFLHMLDAIFVLCRANLLPEAVIEQATHRLRISGAPVIGAILNGHRPSRLQRDYSAYGYGYGYSQGKSERDSVR